MAPPSVVACLERDIAAHRIGPDPAQLAAARRLDALAIDTGYRTHVVYAWARRQAHRINPNTGAAVVHPVKGIEGWGRPAIGTPSLVDIDLDGAKILKGSKVWPIGTWPLKGAFYADLHKLGLKSGQPADPEGYCHFGTWLDENYFKQITAEYLADEAFRGRTRKVWKITSSERGNHLLDCRIYNLALAEYLGLSSTTQAEWAALARRRGMPDAAIVNDLFAPRPAVEGDAATAPAPFVIKDEPEDPFDRLARLNAGHD